MAEFKSKYSLSKVGAQGFCWGGKYTVLLLGERTCELAVLPHPFPHLAGLPPSRLSLLPTRSALHDAFCSLDAELLENESPMDPSS